MPIPWTAERHERLLKAIVLNFSMNTATLANAYNAHWGNFAPILGALP